MSDNVRSQLMRDQSALVRALVQSGPLPAEFDAERLRIAALALVHKRMRSVARNCPNLTTALGDQFSTLFSLYAEDVKPRNNRSTSDEYEFARFLMDRDGLPEMVRREVAKVVARHTRSQRGFLYRICPAVVVSVLRNFRELAVRLRLIRS